MGLFAEQPAVNVRSAADVALLHQLQCKVCPLNKTVGGKMAPTGAENPLVYILGEGPGANEIEEQEQFVGASGEILRANIPRKFKDRVRFNSVVRSRPPGNATPERVEIECCRPSVAADIERSRPTAIFGFGNVPLEWVASGYGGITMWRGRRMPVRIGKHTCWFYPMLHPAYLLHSRRRGNAGEEERMFRFDMRRAFAEVEHLPPAKVHTAEEVRAGVEIILDGGRKGIERVREALHWAAQQPVIGADYETNGLRPYKKDAKILTAAVGNWKRAVAFPFRHPEAQWKPAELAEVEQLWVEFLRNAKGVKAVHNLAFELEWSAFNFGRDTVRAGRWGDSASQAAIIDERKGKGKPGCFSLEWLVQLYFGFNLKKLAGVDRSNLENTPIEAVLYYNAPDAKYHALLYEEQAKVIEEQELWEPYELALRSVPTVVLTQLKGLNVDQQEVKTLSKRYGERLQEIEHDIFALPVIREFEKLKARKFKPLSNPDVLFVFKDLLKRKEVLVEDKYTKKPKYSANEEVLEKINHPLAQLLLDYRTFNKRKSTYVDPLDAGHEESLIFPDGQLHAQFNTFFAETGRLSCESPNLQNFPKRDNDAKEVRKQVVAPSGHVVLAFDYGQIEARIIAMFTQDKHFVKALWERYDVHMEWAERLAHAYPDRVGGKKNLKDKKSMKDFRTDVKNQWTFPLFFGARMESAAGYLKIPENVVRPHYNEFWRQFSGVKQWQENLLEFYQAYGYVECLTGRRRRGPLSTNQIFNSPVQGTAAAVVLDAMSRLSEIGDPELQPEINIHDDLTYARVPEKRVDVVAERVITEMLKVPFEWVNVPISVEMGVGTNWLNIEEYATFSSDEWFK